MKGLSSWFLVFWVVISMGIVQMAYGQAQAIFPLGFDWQGHRGARGLAPENTIPAFLRALEFPEIRTLELDLAVSADGKLVVSHDPVMDAAITSHPDGNPVRESEAAQYKIFKMNYREVRKYDVGKRGNPRFPEQTAMPAIKPTLAAVVKAVRKDCLKAHRSVPFFNIEIKSDPAWDDDRTPPIAVFAALVEQQVLALGISDRVCIQSFDIRALREVHRLNPSRVLAFLDEKGEAFPSMISQLGFLPAIYSPYNKLIDAQKVAEAHRLGMRVIPWTVNQPNEMQDLIRMGVDGIITDYPNRIPH